MNAVTVDNTIRSPRRPGVGVRELQVSMMGTFAIRDATRGPPSAMLGKAQDLLALILLAPQRSVRREHAAESLWPDAGANASKKAMRQALWRIHHATDTAVPESGRLIVTEGEALRVNPERRLWVDVSVLTAAVRVAQTAGPDLADGELAHLGRAADLYRGPLLAGCYGEWCLAPRARIEDGCITLLDTLTRAYERRGSLDASIGWAQRLLDIEPAHELSHRRLMRLHYRNGDRTRALRQFDQCRTVLRQELGVPPSAHTMALGEAIMADRIGDALSPDPVSRRDWHGMAVLDAGPEVVVLAVPRAAAHLMVSMTRAVREVTRAGVATSAGDDGSPTGSSTP